MSYKIQSILIPTDIFNLKQAKKWLSEHNFKFKKVDQKSEHFMRFRQIDPEELKEEGYKIYFTYKLPNKVEYIVAYKKINKIKKK
jgi:hypothetical protein